MIETPFFLCTICARGGSKGVPGKNIRPLRGKPLIAYSIEQAREARIFSAIAVSSDSEEILKVAADFGADLLIRRPDALATDHSGKLPAIVHALEESEKKVGRTADYLIDLDATSPLRLPADIVACANLLQETGCSAVITGTPAHRSPYFNLVEMQADGSVALSKTASSGAVARRQDSPSCFDMNASVYGWRRELLRSDPRVFYRDTRLHIMPRDRSIDIDDELDFAIVSLIMEQRAQK
jgi:CMP-N,N'-diacetyllegionaminic acid synthase